MVGALVGVGVGLAAALITGPEVISKLLAGFFGDLVGAVVGLYWVARAISGGLCTCPAGRFGFCITITFTRLPGGMAVPSPPIISPAPAQCAVLVPVGCP